MSGSEAESQLALPQHQQPFHVTEELLPALLGKLVKLVQENDIKTDAEMDKTIDKAAGEVLKEANTSKAKAESKANVGGDDSKEEDVRDNDVEILKDEKDIKDKDQSNGLNLKAVNDSEENNILKEDNKKTENDETGSKSKQDKEEESKNAQMTEQEQKSGKKVTEKKGKGRSKVSVELNRKDEEGEDSNEVDRKENKESEDDIKNEEGRRINVQVEEKQEESDTQRIVEEETRK